MICSRGSMSRAACQNRIVMIEALETLRRYGALAEVETAVDDTQDGQVAGQKRRRPRACV